MNAPSSHIRKPPKSHRGAALIISLIFLAVLTLTGVAGSQVNMLEERMAGNMRNRSLAFQAAESALRAGEGQLTPTTLPTFAADGTGGYFDLSVTSPSPPNLLDDAGFWQANISAQSGAKVASYSHTLGGVASQPTYVIEKLAYTTTVGAASASREAGVANSSSNAARWYRVTARGTGGTNDAVVTLQSVFRCPGCP